MSKTVIFNLQLKGRQDFKRLEKDVAKLTTAVDKLTSSKKKSESQQKKTNKVLIDGIRLNKRQQEALRGVEGEYRKMSVQLTAARRKAQNMIVAQSKMTRVTKEAKAELAAQLSVVRQMDATLKKADAAVGVHTRSVGNYALSWKSLGASITSVLGVGSAVAVGIVAINKLGDVFRDAKQQIEGFDERIADLRKVTGSTIDEARELATAVSQIDTRTSVNGLLDLAVAGGRLGLAFGEIEGFVRGADQLFIGLGDSLEGTAEDIALKVGKIAQVFGVTDAFGVEQALLKVGSTFNALAASSASTENKILDFSNRLAGVGAVAEITQPEIAALGAFFDESGQSMEIAATTFQRLLPEIGKDMKRFAGIAGLLPEEFEEIAERSPFEALIAVAEGARSGNSGLTALRDTLLAYNVENARASTIVTLLSKDLDRLLELVDLANREFEKGTSVVQEAAIKQETLAAATEQTDRAYSALLLSLDNGEGPLSSAISGWEKLKGEMYELATAFNDGEISFLQLIGSIGDPLLRKARLGELKKMEEDTKVFLDNLKSITEEEFLLLNESSNDIIIGGDNRFRLRSDQHDSDEISFGGLVEDLSAINPNLDNPAQKIQEALDELADKFATVTKTAKEEAAAFDREVNKYADAFAKPGDSIEVLRAKIKQLKQDIDSLASGDEVKAELQLKRKAAERQLKDTIEELKDAIDAAEGLSAAGKTALKENFLEQLQGKGGKAIKDANELLQIEIQKKVIEEAENTLEYKVKLGENEKKLQEDIVDHRLRLEQLVNQRVERLAKEAAKKRKEELRGLRKQLDGFKKDYPDFLGNALSASDQDFARQEREAQEAFNTIAATGNKSEIKRAAADLKRQLIEIRIEAIKTKIELIQALGGELTAKQKADIEGFELQISQLQGRLLELPQTFGELKESLRDGLIDLGEDLLGTLIDNEIEAIERRKDKAIDAVEEEYRAKIDAAQGNAQLQEQLEGQLEKKRMEIEKRVAKQKQSIRIKEAVAETALATIKLIGQLGVFGGLLAAFKLGAQIALIKAQKFEQGGRINRDGTIDGPSHKNGGVLVEVEGGERGTRDEHGGLNIINKRSAKKFKPLLDRIQHANFSGKGQLLSDINSYNGYGVPLARDGLRLTAALPGGVIQQVNGDDYTRRGVIQAVREVLPEMIEGVATASEIGSERGSQKGSQAGVNNGLTRASQTALEAQRLKQRRTA